MSGTDKDLQCRELIAKAVCGRGHRFSQATHTIVPAHTPSTILGCWIINNNFSAEKVGESIVVSGKYDVNLWYSYEGNTQTEVSKETVRYSVDVPLSYFDSNCRGDLEILCQCIEQPKCCRAEIEGSSVRVRVEQEYSVEVVGETKVCVVVCNSCDDDYDKDDFSDDFSDSSDEFEHFDSSSLLNDLD
ncbi:outer spore coat protein CotE [Brevibacillus daliensis]|uniref:outer spore coat protein CotE n=1 Tax=Brevibacillus daliensis TaxID=2892995 RepID=UPI001E3B07D9|nr:outer spore coat protein CotE [Brevibacillus daliensis]